MFAALASDGSEVKISSANILKYIFRRYIHQRTANMKLFSDLGLWESNALHLLFPTVSTRRGVPHIVFGVPHVTPSRFDGPLDTPEFIDVARVNTARPADFNVLCKIAGDWIGESVLHGALGEPLRLAADPLSWLRLISRGDPAVCWIGRDPAAFAERMQYHPRVICDTAAHAAIVHKAIRYVPPRKLARVSYETEGADK